MSGSIFRSCHHCVCRDGGWHRVVSQINHLPQSQPARLRVAYVMGVRWTPSADGALLNGNIAEMLFAMDPPRLGRLELSFRSAMITPSFQGEKLDIAGCRLADRGDLHATFRGNGRSNDAIRSDGHRQLSADRQQTPCDGNRRRHFARNSIRPYRCAYQSRYGARAETSRGT